MRIALAAAFVAATTPAGWGSAVTAVSHIDAVTVYPTGAEITRIAKLKLEAANAQLDIGSVDTQRVFAPRTDVVSAASERKHLEEEIEKLKDKALSQAEIHSKSFFGKPSTLPLRIGA
jgi:hypothetical protein